MILPVDRCSIGRRRALAHTFSSLQLFQKTRRASLSTALSSRKVLMQAMAMEMKVNRLIRLGSNYQAYFAVLLQQTPAATTPLADSLVD